MADKKHGGKGSRSKRWADTRATDGGGPFFIAGLNGVLECLRARKVRVHTLWADTGQLDPATRRAIRAAGVPVTAPEAGGTPHGPLQQGVAAWVDPPAWPSLAAWLKAVKTGPEAPLVVVLDQVSDPMNLGQILRTCEVAGAGAVVVPSHRAAHLNQTVAQVSQGAFAHLPLIEVVNLRAALALMKEYGLWVVGCEAAPAARSWRRADFTRPTALVFGSEGRGLRQLTARTCDLLAALPLHGHLNSLNVGAAVAAFLYEARRQRLDQRDGG